MRWTSWAPIPNKPTVSVDVKQQAATIVAATVTTTAAVAASVNMKRKMCSKMSQTTPVASLLHFV